MQPPGEAVTENSSNCNNETGNFNTRQRIPLLAEQEIHFHWQTIRISPTSRRWTGLDTDQEGFSEVPTWAAASIQLSSDLWRILTPPILHAPTTFRHLSHEVVSEVLGVTLPILYLYLLGLSLQSFPLLSGQQPLPTNTQECSCCTC